MEGFFYGTTLHASESKNNRFIPYYFDFTSLIVAVFVNGADMEVIGKNSGAYVQVKRQQRTVQSRCWKYRGKNIL